MPEPIQQGNVAPPGPKSRIVQYDQYFDQRTFSVTLRKTAKPPRRQNHKNRALVVRRIIDSKGQLDRIEIDIETEALVAALKVINNGVWGVNLNRNPPSVSPETLFHSFRGLQEILEEEQLKEAPDEVFVSDIESVLQFTRNHHANVFSELDKISDHGEVSYNSLWALFVPNTYVYHYDLLEQDQVLIFRSLAYGIRMDTRTPFAKIACQVISRGGKTFGLSYQSLEIDGFEGAKKITELPVFPLDYHPDSQGIRDRAIARGIRFVKMEGSVFKVFHGTALREGDKQNVLKFLANGRVMIDPAALHIFEPNSIFNVSVSKVLDKDNLTDDQYMICTPIALGFSFGVKKWGGFAMDRLEDVKWSEEPFNSLVLDEQQKTLIYSLIKQHNSRPENLDDFVRGKGKGLIGLLSGPPGSGKTLTAEATAELTRRPLYPVSAGELGTTPAEVDIRLRRILELAQTWNAVLLIDEVEVFVQTRNTIDLARNAMVSVFLRELEYYQGILILTTNLPGQIDPAFESRIHFCVDYPSLGISSRKNIWKKFLDKTQTGATSLSEEELNKLARHELNGRQIKNAVFTAQSIALEEQSPLLFKHVNTVMEVLSKWNVTRTKAIASSDSKIDLD